MKIDETRANEIKNHQFENTCTEYIQNTTKKKNALTQMTTDITKK